MIAFCTDKRRRDLVLQTQGLNGIDYVEVLGAAGCGSEVAVTFLKPVQGLGLTVANFALSGDTVLQVTGVAAAAGDGLTLVLSLDGTGDFAPYTLSLVNGVLVNGEPDTAPDAGLPAGIDRQLASVTFSFKAACASPVDCEPAACCPAPAVTAPDINYLARDYDGFRQAMLDRMATLAPGWTERHAADAGITLVEALAYAADRVSYLQDAVNTEAYIGTARSRISLRRHARLVDYHVSEGANARAWVCVAVDRPLKVPAGTVIYPLVSGLGASVEPGSYQSTLLAASPGPVFESLADLQAFPELGAMDFYTWGDGGCCLQAGATDAWLTGAFENLHAGDVLILEEMVGPLTGEQADADPTHRWAVRLTEATTRDQSGNPLVDPVTTPPQALTYIAWGAADALPFPLCLASVTDADHGAQPLGGVSVAHGNVLAADQGVWVESEPLHVVPAAPAGPVAGIGCNCTGTTGGETGGAAAVRPYYRPVLQQSPLTFAVAFDGTAAAATFLNPDISQAAPQIGLAADDGTVWIPVEDLLDEGSEFTGFVPEIEFDGTAHLRFGDGTYGAAPHKGVKFAATYRVGNGSGGNVGREALAHVLFNGPGITGVRNPIGAAGGTDMEGMEHIRQVAPFAFATNLRCVTAEDYGTQAAEVEGVAAARGTMRWTGSWYTAFVSVEGVGGSANVGGTALAKSVKQDLNKLRMMGVDLQVEGAVLVGIRIGLEICVAPGYFQGDVYAAVWKVLVTGDSCTGKLGLLNPANFVFGETVYASPIVAAAQQVTGVVAVTLTTFERMDRPRPAWEAVPVALTFGPLEIPRCDNDPDHADRGVLTLTLDGGK